MAKVAGTGPGFMLGVSENRLGELLRDCIHGTPSEGAEAVFVCVSEIGDLEVMSRRAATCCKCSGPCFLDVLIEPPPGAAFVCVKWIGPDVVSHLKAILGLG